MITKFRLYLDSLSRFTTKQMWYLFFNRVWKKIFLNSTAKEEKLTNDEIITYDDFNSNLKNSFDIEWEQIFSKEQYPYPEHYTNLVEKLVSQFGKSDFVEVDYFNNSDLSNEVQNNFQRFYLFYEIQNYKNIQIEVGLIDYWINNFSSKKMAWESFNCAIRLLNWFKILSSISSLEDNKWIKIQNSIYSQSKNIINNIHHDVPGNHVVLQYFSLWLVLKFFPKWNFAKNEIYNIEVNLVNEIEGEFEKSGFHFEKSFHYHVQITLMALIYQKLKNEFNEPINSRVNDIVTKAAGLINRFNLGDYHVAMFGDNCYNFFTSNLFSDIEFIKELAKEQQIKLDEQRVPVCEVKNQYVVVEKYNSKLIFDVGELGLYQNPGHGHSDLLSFVYSDNNKAIFIDPGVKEYSNSPESMELKKSNYHNTLSINDSDQALLWGFFRWAYLPEVGNYKIEEDDGHIRLASSYLGFKEIGPYKHSREIILSEGKLIIKDKVDGKKSEDISINFILSSDVLVEQLKEEVNLKVADLKYYFICESMHEYSVKQEDIEIYRNYNTPTKSKRIVVNFKKPKLPFESKIVIKRKPA